MLEWILYPYSGLIGPITELGQAMFNIKVEVSRTEHVSGSHRPKHPEALALRPALARRPPSEPDSAHSALVLHTIIVGGRRIAVRLEPAVWAALRDIARRQEVTVQ